jgi:hypothetical protein
MALRPPLRTVQRWGSPPSGRVLIACTVRKAPTADALHGALSARGLRAERHDLHALSPAARRTLGNALPSLSVEARLVVLADPPDAVRRHLGDIAANVRPFTAEARVPRRGWRASLSIQHRPSSRHEP